MTCDIDVPALIAAYRSGRTLAAIAREAHIGTTTAWVALRKAGEPMRHPAHVSGSRGRARALANRQDSPTPEQVEAMIAAYTAGRSLEVVARETGSSKNTVKRRLLAAGVPMRGKRQSPHRAAEQAEQPAPKVACPLCRGMARTTPEGALYSHGPVKERCAGGGSTLAALQPIAARIKEAKR